MVEAPPAPETPAGAPAAKHVTGSPLKSAYLLFYRKKQPQNLNTITDELVPETLREWMQAENARYNELKQEWQYERSFLHLKVPVFTRFVNCPANVVVSSCYTRVAHT